MTPQPSFGAPPAGTGELNGPSLGLVVSGSLGIISGLTQLASGLIQLMGGAKSVTLDDPSVPSALQTYMKVMSSGAVPLLFALLTLAVNGLIIFAGLQMRQARQYNLCVAGAALCCVPCCFHSCCSLFVVPLGVWALAVLLSGHTKAQFSA